ncbi:MAG: YXWGXW repeat-containing protein [Thermoanaerobaculia bacterium]
MRGRRTIYGLIGVMLVTSLGMMTLAGCVVAPPGAVYVRMAPPPPMVETIGVAPGAGYVWIGGHHAWRGEAYVWVPGRWELRPHEHDRWVPGRWRHNREGWFWVEGRWK